MEGETVEGTIEDGRDVGGLWVEGEREFPMKVVGLFVVGIWVVETGDAWIEVKEVAGIF